MQRPTSPWPLASVVAWTGLAMVAVVVVATIVVRNVATQQRTSTVPAIVAFRAMVGGLTIPPG
jgi:hypothetical protein